MDTQFYAKLSQWKIWIEWGLIMWKKWELWISYNTTVFVIVITCTQKSWTQNSYRWIHCSTTHFEGCEFFVYSIQIFKFMLIYANLCKLYANGSLCMQICKNVFWSVSASFKNWLKRTKTTHLHICIHNEQFAYNLHKFEYPIWISEYPNRISENWTPLWMLSAPLEVHRACYVKLSGATVMWLQSISRWTTGLHQKGAYTYSGISCP